MNYKKANYHTHTNFCDGADSIEQNILCAIKNNFDILGFSSHSMYPFAHDWHIAPREHDNYIMQLNVAKEKYKDSITILKGFEADYVKSFCAPDFANFAKFDIDYLIGSVHFVVTDKGNVTVDESAEGIQAGLDKLFSGNGKKLVQEYFFQQREMIRTCNFTILGHPDLVRKRNGQLKFFDENDLWYKKEVKQLVREIKKSDVLVEVNTGAITRGAMNDVYPSKYFLSLLRENNVPVIISSDSHSADTLDSYFDKAILACIKAGYTEHAILVPSRDSASKVDVVMQKLI